MLKYRGDHNKKYVKAKMSECPEFKLGFMYYLRVRKAMAKYRTKPCILPKHLLGISVGEFKAYLESKFVDGMSWDNYGMKGWVVDHVRPCASFDLSDPNQQVLCFHYTNTQPLWRLDNQKKTSKWEGS
jgi:hypothetical protein